VDWAREHCIASERGVGAGRRDEKSASNLREKSGEREASRKRESKKKKTRPLRNVSAHSRFLPLLFLSLLFFKGSGRAAKVSS
jgi:hypothetical protein